MKNEASSGAQKIEYKENEVSERALFFIIKIVEKFKKLKKLKGFLNSLNPLRVQWG